MGSEKRDIQAPHKDSVRLYVDGMKISILIPTWNNVEYMKIIIPAIRKHTIVPYEILVYANEISSEMKEYASKESFDVFEHSHKNEGIALAVNLLAKQATGDMIFYLNDDMYVAPGWDEALVRKINDTIFYQYLTSVMFEPRWENPTVNTPFDFGRTPETWQEQKFLSEWWDLRQIKEDIISGNTPTFVKKELWDSIGGYDKIYWPGFGTDPDFVAKIYYRAKREGKPYEFRGVADCGVYHFQCVSTERIQNAKLYRQKSHKRFKAKWSMEVLEFITLIDAGEGKRI